MFDDLDGFVEQKRDDAEHDNAGDHHVQAEHLGAVDDQIAQAASRRQKFSDDHAHQRKADVYFGGAEQDGNGARQDYLCKGIPLCAAQGISVIFSSST